MILDDLIPYKTTAKYPASVLEAPPSNDDCEQTNTISMNKNLYTKKETLSNPHHDRL